MTKNQEVLGQILFPAGLREPSMSKDLFELIHSANPIEAIEKEVHALKLEHKEIRQRIAFIETIFRGLSNPKLPNSMLSDSIGNLTGKESMKFIRACRERIGRIALEVFFDSIWEKSKKVFWEYLSHVSFRYGYAPSLSPKPRPGEEGEGTSKPRLGISPTTLYPYLEYFTLCNEATKQGFEGKIKKFLQYALNEPLSCSGSENRFNFGISQWSNQGRVKLAQTLTAHGMYEECLDFHIPEAYQVLASKFLGAFHEEMICEEKTGLMHWECFYPSCMNKKTSILNPQQAMEKAHQDKEWGHILSTIIRMALKHGHAKITKTFDVSAPIEFRTGGIRTDGSPATIESVNMRLAILWHNPTSPMGF